MGKTITKQDKRKNHAVYLRERGVKRIGSFNNGPLMNQGVGSAANRRRNNPKVKNLRGSKPKASETYGRRGRRRFAGSM